MFEEKYEKTNNTIKITVSINKRKLAIENKLIYMKDPKDNIPEEFRDKVLLKKSPEKPISNINSGKYTNIGVWVYQIKPQRRSNKTKVSTKDKLSDTIVENKKKS